MSQRNSNVQLQVEIMDQSYTLACPKKEQSALMAAVNLVNRTMGGIREAGKIRARDRIAVLAALQIAHKPNDTEPNPIEVAREKRIQGLLEQLDRLLAPDEAPVTTSA